MSMIFMEFDLSGAEWVVMAYLSNDANMLSVVTSGKSPHVVTGSLISGAPEDFVTRENDVVGNQSDPDIVRELRQSLPELSKPHTWFLPRSMSIRQAGKKSNHGLNYGMKYKRFALENEIPEKDAETMVEMYSTTAYPGLKDYWAGIRQELKDNDRCLVNCLGRKVRLLEEWGHELFMAAYSFKPQSTVVDSVNEAMCKVFECEDEIHMPMELTAQVHDSLKVQYPIPVDDSGWERMAQFALRVREYMRPELHYSGHTFRLGSDLKIGTNWGYMHSIKMTENVSELALRLKRVYSVVYQESLQLASSVASLEVAAEPETLPHTPPETDLPSHPA